MYSVRLFLYKKLVSRKDSIVYDLPMNPIVFIPAAGCSESKPYKIKVEPNPM
jgi:hypothetical protein